MNGTVPGQGETSGGFSGESHRHLPLTSPLQGGGTTIFEGVFHAGFAAPRWMKTFRTRPRVFGKIQAEHEDEYDDDHDFQEKE